MKHLKDIQKFVRDGDFVNTPNGVLIHSCILGIGRYTSSVNGGKDPEYSYNLIPAEGIAYVIGAAWLASQAKLSAWFLAPYSGNVDPAANWTGANFTSLATEITSATEGFSNATRPAWTPGAITAGVLGNLAAKAVFNIVCTTNVNIAGAGLLSSNVRGGVTGVLSSATRFPSVRAVYNGDAFELGYEVELQDS
jgi:hypothetical protein